MTAEYRFAYWLHGVPIKMVTARKTKNGKTAHLFADFVGGATSGYRIAYCNRGGWSDTGLSSKYGNWRVAEDIKVCNNCMRAWRSEQRRKNCWHGEP